MSDLALKRTILQLEKRLAFIERNTAAPGVRRRQSGTTPPWFWALLTSNMDVDGNYTFSSARLIDETWTALTVAEGLITGTVHDGVFDDDSDWYKGMKTGALVAIHVVTNDVAGAMGRYYLIYGNAFDISGGSSPPGYWGEITTNNGSGNYTITPTGAIVTISATEINTLANLKVGTKIAYWYDGGTYYFEYGVHVSVTATTEPGFLDDVLTTPDAWLSNTVNGDDLELKHALDVARDIDLLTSVALTYAANTIGFPRGQVNTDAAGHVIGNATITPTQSFSFAGDTWLSVSTTFASNNLEIKYEHATPFTAATLERVNDIDVTLTDKFTLNFDDMDVDDAGHVTANNAVITGKTVSFYGGDNLSLTTTHADTKNVEFTFDHDSAGSTNQTVTIDTGTGLDGTGTITFDAKGHSNNTTKSITLTLDLTELTGYVSGNDQVIVHEASGSPKWVDMGC